MAKFFFHDKYAHDEKHHLLEKKIKRYLKDYRAILDIGYVSCPNKFLPNIYGIDVQDKPDRLPENYKETKVVNLNTESIPYEDGFFDGVFAVDVIEHLSNAQKFLFEVNRVLKSDAHVFIHTPNANYFGETLNNIFVNRSPLAMGHVNLFTRRTMRVLFKHAGFDMVEEVGFSFSVPKTNYRLCVEKFPAFAFEIMYIGKKIRQPEHGLHHKDIDGKSIQDSSRFF